MSLDTTLARIASLQSLLQPQPVQQPVPQTATQFSSMLQGANASASTTMIPGATSAPGTPAGQAILNAIRPEVGQAEQPPGSNDSPRIAQYRQATAGSGVGPWCAYFVDDVFAWAQKTGKALPAGSTPSPGDLIVWDEHIGVVERVDPDGTIHTIEGNSSDQVSQRTYSSDGGGAVGYVRLG